METRHDERVQQLLLAIKRSDKLHLKDAARLLGVSEMTIRRDINTTDAPVTLLGGYLVIEAHAANASNYLLSVQKHRLVKEKQFIGRLAAKLVKPHHTVFFDCGTTTPWIINAIADDLPFTGICYSLNTFLSLQEKPMCQVILCGGSSTMRMQSLRLLPFRRRWIICARTWHFSPLPALTLRKE